MFITQKNKKIPTKEILDIPMVMLRGVVIMPETLTHFDVGRPKSVESIKFAINNQSPVFLVTQQDPVNEGYSSENLFDYGVIGNIKQMINQEDNDKILRVLVEAGNKAKLLSITDLGKYFMARVEVEQREDVDIGSANIISLTRQVKSSFNMYCEELPHPPTEIIGKANNESDPTNLINLICSTVMMDYVSKQFLLEQPDIESRLFALDVIIEKEIDIISFQSDIIEQVQENMDARQKEYYIREQIKVLQQQLGSRGDDASDLEEFQEKIEKIKNISEETRQKLLKECDRLSRNVNFPQEASHIRSYLETCLSLPWDIYTKDKIDIVKAKNVLDKDHYGLEKVKERILELLAVLRLSPKIKGQIICLVGPPGVGKTSIGSSIAKTLGRKFARVSLGGVRDESDIRGHRKTYIGAMPGRIINAIISAKSNNPVILLDEIDKMSNDFRGDPSSAMLEVLDSAQNNAFRDHFLEIPYDLSDVLFITTANNAANIPLPLLDRMEVIELTSYTREEKFNIAKKYLVPKQLKKNGLNGKLYTIKPQAIYDIIDSYTKEAGVRNLERIIGSTCRKAAKLLVSEEKAKVDVTPALLQSMIGNKKYIREDISKENEIGVVSGLAWTSVGGELLEIEVAILQGSGKIKLTGSLGDVMKESAEIAVSFVRSIAKEFNIDPDFYKNMDIHIHAPEGAVPKDGPSAGVTMVTALVSALANRYVSHEVAMTGEVSLRGHVLQIGGLKEKAMAAYRAGKKMVIIPKNNFPDVEEMDDVIKDNIKFIPVSHVNEVLSVALIKETV